MAPCSSFSPLHQTRTERDPLRLRKPIVEKMRRDRINSCIEQLKLLLEKEFQREPSSKLEKADVLEMTVSFLRQQLQPGLAHRGPHTEAWVRVPHTGPQLTPSTLKTSSTAPVWRPW